MTRQEAVQYFSENYVLWQCFWTDLERFYDKIEVFRETGDIAEKSCAGAVLNELFSDLKISERHGFINHEDFESIREKLWGEL